MALIKFTAKEKSDFFCNKIFQTKDKVSKKNIFAISINRKKRALV